MLLFLLSLVCLIFVQVRTTCPVQYFLFGIVFTFTNVFFCLHVWTICHLFLLYISPIISSISRDSSRDNWTSAILVNSSLSYAYSRLTNLSLCACERSCSPYRLPGQVKPKAFPSAINHVLLHLHCRFIFVTQAEFLFFML